MDPCESEIRFLWAKISTLRSLQAASDTNTFTTLIKSTVNKATFQTQKRNRKKSKKIKQKKKLLSKMPNLLQMINKTLMTEPQTKMVANNRLTRNSYRSFPFPLKMKIRSQKAHLRLKILRDNQGLQKVASFTLKR